MSEEQLLEILRSRLTLEVTTDEASFAYDSGITVRVRLLLDGDVIDSASDSFRLPSKD